MVIDSAGKVRSVNQRVRQNRSTPADQRGLCLEVRVPYDGRPVASRLRLTVSPKR